MRSPVLSIYFDGDFDTVGKVDAMGRVPVQDRKIIGSRFPGVRTRYRIGLGGIVIHVRADGQIRDATHYGERLQISIRPTKYIFSE